MTTPSWTQLHALGTNKVVNTSFIWLAVIPFLSRLLESIHAWTQHVPTLPFNFVAFYFAAFFFSIAALIFNWKCPTIAKLAPNYGVFKLQGYSSRELKEWYLQVIAADKVSGNPTGAMKTFIRLVEGSTLRIPASNRVDEVYPAFIECEIEHRLPAAHSHVIGNANHLWPNWRKVAALNYGLGFFLFGIVAVANLVVVAKASWRMAQAWFA